MRSRASKIPIRGVSCPRLSVKAKQPYPRKGKSVRGATLKPPWSHRKGALQSVDINSAPAPQSYQKQRKVMSAAPPLEPPRVVALRNPPATTATWVVALESNHRVNHPGPKKKVPTARVKPASLEIQPPPPHPHC